MATAGRVCAAGGAGGAGPLAGEARLGAASLAEGAGAGPLAAACLVARASLLTWTCC
jgi:hypothetical protein